MSERFAASIRIGGTLSARRAHRLRAAIRDSHVRLDWGETFFEPTRADELLSARRDGTLELSDEEARYGEFTELEATCRRLQLNYQRHSEAGYGLDATLTCWQSGLRRPITFRGSNEYSNELMLIGSEVRPALEALVAGKAKRAIAILRKVLGAVPALPPFEIHPPHEPDIRL